MGAADSSDDASTDVSESNGGALFSRGESRDSDFERAGPVDGGAEKQARAAARAADRAQQRALPRMWCTVLESQRCAQSRSRDVDARARRVA